MALASTMYNFEISLSDVDRNVYETLSLKVAQHPSESTAYLLTRVLAYCLEYREGITFTKGLSESDEPAIWALDQTGQLTLWVEIGSPSAERLHRASKRGVEIAVYTHKNPEILLEQLRGKDIFHGDQMRLYGVSSELLSAFESHLERRNEISLSVSEGHLYVSIKGQEIAGTATKLTLNPA